MANSSELSANTRFFVVDDAPTSRELMVQNLKTLGFRHITEGFSEGESLAILEEKEFDLIICQKNMRQMSGFEFLSEIRENMAIKSTPFLLMGEGFPKEDQTQFLEAIPDELLKTPFLLKEITLKLSQTLKKFYEKDNIEYIYEQARLLYVHGDYTASIEIYRALILKYPSSARALVGAARNHRALGHLDDAEANLKIAIQNNKYYTHAYFDLAIVQLAKDQKANAHKSLDYTIQKNPKNPVRYEAIANLFTRLEMYEDAESYLMRAIKTNLVYPKLYAQVGRNYLSQRKKDQALEFLQRAVEQDPKNPSFLNSIGICYKEMAKYEDSLTHYNMALKVAPNDVKILYNKVLCLVTMKDYDRAKKVCQQILKIDPKHSRASFKIVEIDNLAVEAPIEPKFKGVISK